MARRPYRVEVVYPKKGKPTYYLVKDVSFRGKKRKAKKYIGSGKVAPTIEEIEEYREKYAYDMEIKAAQKRAELSNAFYKPYYISKDILYPIEEMRYVYKALMELLTTNEWEVYEKNFEIHYIHGTTAIEGNTLSDKESFDLLLYNIPPQDKTMREINEVQNFKNVIKYRNAYHGKVTLDFIKNLHAWIMSNIDYESAGVFRRSDDVGIVGCDLRITPAVEIENELKQIIDSYYKRLDENYHPFEQAVLFHHEFELIHPFADGNGRVGREIFNYMLMKEKYPKLLFLGKNRSQYVNGLKYGNDDNYEDMVKVFVDIIIDQRLNVLKENLKNAVKPLTKTGQMRITDFVNI